MTTDFIYVYASFAVSLTFTICYGFICHYKICQKYKQFEERDDIEFEFAENEDNCRNNNDFIP